MLTTLCLSSSFALLCLWVSSWCSSFFYLPVKNEDRELAPPFYLFWAITATPMVLAAICVLILQHCVRSLNVSPVHDTHLFLSVYLAHRHLVRYPDVQGKNLGMILDGFTLLYFLLILLPNIFESRHFHPFMLPLHFHPFISFTSLPQSYPF